MPEWTRFRNTRPTLLAPLAARIPADERHRLVVAILDDLRRRLAPGHESIRTFEDRHATYSDGEIQRIWRELAPGSRPRPLDVRAETRRIVAGTAAAVTVNIEPPTPVVVPGVR